MKNWVSKMAGVESKGVRGMEVSTRSAAAMVWAERSQTTSKSWKPTSSMRAKILSTVSANGISGVLMQETSAIHTKRLGDKTVGSGLSGILAAEEELELGRTGALSEPDGTRELEAARNISIARITPIDTPRTSQQSRCCDGQ